MFSANEINSLTDFQRNAKDYVKRLNTNKRPEILTVNGKAAVVIQDAKAYQEMIDLINTIDKVNASALAFDNGEGKPVEEVFSSLDEKIKSKYGE